MTQVGKIQRWKRLSIPVLLGIFAAGVVVLCAVYFQEKNRQKDLASQIGQLSQLVSQNLDVDAELLERFEQIEQKVPVVSSNPSEGHFSKLQLIEWVNTLVVDRVSDPVTYPGIDTGPTGNFKIKYDSESRERVGSTNYLVLKFNVDISGSDYNTLRYLVHDIGTMESLPTLVVTRLTVIPEVSPSYVDLDFDIYCIAG